MSIFSKKKVRQARRTEGENRPEPQDQDSPDESSATLGPRTDRAPRSTGSRGKKSKKKIAIKLSAEERKELAEATLRKHGENKSSEADAVVPVTDRRTRMLLERKIVTSPQVEEALERGADTENLWRLIVDVNGVDTTAVYAAIAQDAGIHTFQYLDAVPSREFMEELIPIIGDEVLLALLDAGLLPVEQEPGLEKAPSRLTVATHDPTHPDFQDVVQDLPFQVICNYASESELAERLDTARGWITNISRYGTAPVTADGPVSTSTNGSANTDTDAIIDLGSYGVEGGFSIDPKKTEAVSDTPEKKQQTESAATEGRHSPSSDPPKAQPNRVDAEPSDTKSVRRGNALVVKDRVLDWLLRKGVVTIDQIRIAQEETKTDGSKDASWRYLAEMEGVSKEDVFREVAGLYAFKTAVIKEGIPDHDFVLLTMETIVETRQEDLINAMLFPYEYSIDTVTGTGRMVFVTHDPTRPDINTLLHQLDLGRFEIQYASESEINKLLLEIFPKRNEYLEKLSSEGSAFDLGTSHEDDKNVMIDEDALEAEMSRSNLINLFEASLIEAVRQSASDIHIFPNPKRQIEIHFRRDGRLKKWHTEENVHPEAFLAVVKDNSSGVDRFERDKAQDGFIQRIIDDTLIRFRVSILPVASANVEIRAESIVIRILDDRKVLTDLSALGMLEVAKERFDKAIRQPNGMIILTGPTGSGKSTTLVASLYQVITPEVNVLTVEDPVEYIIKGVRQIKLSHKLTLDLALRSILRHDPDIVMVGEMRDQQTAELAIKLANTGHLTFSTLHTNDAPAAVSRLYKMGIEPFLIAYAINLIVAQRLIRTLCPDCRQIDKDPDRVLMKSLGWSESDIDDMTLFKSNRGSGCTTCSSLGYKGRRALCETLYFSDKIRHMIAGSEGMVDEDAIRDVAMEEGMLTLQDSARVLVSMGATSVDEMLRVTGSS